MKTGQLPTSLHAARKGLNLKIEMAAGAGHKNKLSKTISDRHRCGK